MATYRVAHSFNARYGLGLQTNQGVIAINAAGGFNADIGNTLHNFQVFLGKIDNIITTNDITHLVPLECAEPLAANYHPDDYNAFIASQANFNNGGSSYRQKFPIWSRYYKYQPAGIANPLFLRFVGGIQGTTNGTNFEGSASIPYIEVEVSYGFNDVTGFYSVLFSYNCARFPTLDGYFNNGAVYVTNYLYAYLTDEVFYIVPQCNRLTSNATVAAYLGKTSDYALPENLPSGVICAKAVAHVPGMGTVNEAVVLVGDRFGGDGIGVSNQNNNNASITQEPYSVASMITNLGAEVRAPFSFSGSATIYQTPARMLTCPYTYVTGSGTVYQIPGLLYMSDPVRNLLAVRDYFLNVQGVMRRVLVAPCMQSPVRSTVAAVNGINAVSIGVLLDDSIINA